MQDKPGEDPQFGNVVSGVFTPVLAKHSKSFLLVDCISVGVDRMQRKQNRTRVEAARSIPQWRSRGC